MYFESGRKRKRELLSKKSFPSYYKLSLARDDINRVKFEDLPIYSFDMLANATDNFHLSSKLGQGGFGSVYKVMFVCLIERFVIFFFRKEIEVI